MFAVIFKRPQWARASLLKAASCRLHLHMRISCATLSSSLSLSHSRHTCRMRNERYTTLVKDCDSVCVRVCIFCVLCQLNQTGRGSCWQCLPSPLFLLLFPARFARLLLLLLMQSRETFLAFAPVAAAAANWFSAVLALRFASFFQAAAEK